MNIGVHFFDMLLWIFGAVERNDVYLCDHLRASGYLELERARVRWFMSIDSKDLPSEAIQNKLPAYRSLTIDDEEVNFSQGFDDLHTSVYRDILAGGGFSLNEARGAIKLVHAIRTAKLCHERKYIHPQLQ
jgi:UDP-N-acetyl-2-amino-2-deoxyglucuronate dehydrogenase